MKPDSSFDGDGHGNLIPMVIEMRLPLFAGTAPESPLIAHPSDNHAGKLPLLEQGHPAHASDRHRHNTVFAFL